MVATVHRAAPLRQDLLQGRSLATLTLMGSSPILTTKAHQTVGFSRCPLAARHMHAGVRRAGVG